MNCFFCRGTLEDSFTNHVVNMEKCIIIVKNVPCEKCKQCGESFYSDEVSEKLEALVKKFKDPITEVAIIEYSDRVA